MDKECCCGTCKYHCPSEIPGQEDWYCNNAESDAYGVETAYDDECYCWEGRE